MTTNMLRCTAEGRWRRGGGLARHRRVSGLHPASHYTTTYWLLQHICYYNIFVIRRDLRAEVRPSAPPLSAKSTPGVSLHHNISVITAYWLFHHICHYLMEVLGWSLCTTSSAASDPLLQHIGYYNISVIATYRLL